MTKPTAERPSNQASLAVLWRGTNGEVVDFVLTQAEKLLAAQLATALASDQRAITLAGVCGTATTVLIGGVVASLSAASPIWMLVVPGSAAAICFALSTFFCVKAARPAVWYHVGNQPASFAERDILDSPLAELKWGEASNCQERISHNEGVLKRNSEFLNLAVVLAGLAPAAAGLVALVLAVI